MTLRSLALSALAAVVLGATASATLAADVANGANVFTQECSDCHSMSAGKNKKGPTLSHVIGRKAGTVADFTNYSDAMKASGISWSADKIAAYVKAPRSFLAGGTMKYDGLADPKASADLLAYLAAGK